MASKICKAYLGLRSTDYNGINNQANLFLDNFYKESEIYPQPPKSEAFFRAQYQRSKDATIAAIKGSSADKALRNQECAATYWIMEQELIPYINSLYSGNRTLLERSGAKVTDDPCPVPPPDRPIILKVVKGPEPNTIKIFPVRGINSKQKRRARIRYRIFMFLNEDDPVGKEIGSTFSSIDLIGRDVPFDVYHYFAINGMNTGGTSPLSEKVRFLLSPY
jgi:hypothetical protein